MTIRRRFILVFSLFSMGLAALFASISYGIARNSLEAQLDQLLVWTAGAAAETGLQGSIALSLLPGFEDLEGFREYEAKLGRLRLYVDGAWIFRAEDRTALVTSFGDSIPIGTQLRIFDPYQSEIEEALRVGEGTTPVFEGVDGRLYKYGFKQLEQTDAILALLIPADFLAPLRRLRDLLLLGTVLGVVLAVILGTALAGGIATPLERLSRAALRIQRGRLERPVQMDREDEIGRLAGAMERMRLGIQKRDEQLRLMLAQVAHEIRNPLGGLELFASAASDTEDPLERDHILGRIRGEVIALNRIIDEFLTFARPSSVEPELVDVRIPIEAAVHLSGDREERIQVRLPEDPLMARVDRDSLKRLVLNLIRNALQVAERVRVEAGELNGELVIAVSDDGPGVAPELRERIFEPFVTDKEQGAGLGLAIVRRVAEAHGGRVELADGPDPRFGKGAEFRVYLPGLDDLPPADPSGTDEPG